MDDRIAPAYTPLTHTERRTFETFNNSESNTLHVQVQKVLQTSGRWTFGYSISVEYRDTDDAKVIKLLLMATQGLFGGK